MSELLEALLKSNDLNTIIKRNEKESLFIEYKSGEWLKTDEEGKFNLRKWVSSFANSAGGTLIIGISEKKKDNEIFPDKITGIDSTKFKEEIGKLIEDVLKEKIYPRLNPPPRIITFPTDSSQQKFVALIEIQQTNFYIHKVMIKDGKEEYFHRHNFQVLSMDEWEIRTLLFGRIPPPILDLSIEKIYVGASWNSGTKIRGYVMDIKVENIGWQIAKYLQLGIVRPSVDFDTTLSPNNGSNFVTNKKDYLSNSLNNFFDVNDNKVIVDTIILLKPDFLHPYDSLKISYSIKNYSEFPVFSKIYFGFYILAENLIKPEIYAVEVLYLGKDQKPIFECHPYENQKIKILAHK